MIIQSKNRFTDFFLIFFVFIIRIIRIVAYISLALFYITKGVFEGNQRVCSIAVRLDRFKDFVHWLESNQVRTNNTRIHRYLAYLIELNKTKSLKKKFFKNSLNPELIFVLREIDELIWIYEGFDGVTLNNYEKEVFKKIVGGKDFAIDDIYTNARNFQFELRIASYFKQQSFQVTINKESDVIATKDDITLIIECKRLYSPNQIENRVKECYLQLERTINLYPVKQKVFGIAVFDVTKIAFPHQGMTWGFSLSHAKRNIQKKLLSVISNYDFAEVFNGNENVVAIWVKVHIPSIAFGKYPATRFSSVIIPQTPFSDWRMKGFKIFNDAFVNASKKSG